MKLQKTYAESVDIEQEQIVNDANNLDGIYEDDASSGFVNSFGLLDNKPAFANGNDFDNVSTNKSSEAAIIPDSNNSSTHSVSINDNAVSSLENTNTENIIEDTEEDLSIDRPAAFR